MALIPQLMSSQATPCVAITNTSVLTPLHIRYFSAALCNDMIHGGLLAAHKLCSSEGPRLKVPTMFS